MANRRSGQDRPRLLVVDDNEGIRALMTMLLGDDYDVTVAETGRECLDLATSSKPDLLMLDARLPDMTGADVVAVLRDDPLTSALRIMMVSGDNVTEETAARFRIDDFVRKPFDIKELRAHIEVLLAR